MTTSPHLLARNTVLNLAGAAVTLPLAAVTIPLIIRGLGTDRFGVLAIAWVLLGYFSTFDLGLGRATTKFVAESLATDDRPRISRIVWTAAAVQLALGIAGALALAALTPWLVNGGLRIPAELRDEIRLTFYALAIAIPAVLVAGSFRGVLEAAQRFDAVNAIRVPLSIANLVLPLIAVLLGWRLPGILMLLVGARVVGLAAHYWWCIRLWPFLGERIAFAAADARTLLGFGGWVTVSSVVAPLLVHFDRFAIGAFASLAAVGYYSAPYEIVTRLWIVPASLVATMFPAVTTLSQTGRHDAIGELMTRSLKYLLLGLGPVIILVITFGWDLMRIWLGADFAAQSALALRILAAGVLINSLTFVPLTAIQALGRPDLVAKVQLIELPINLALVWGLVRLYGIPGAALAWSLRVTLDAVLLFACAWHLGSLPRTVWEGGGLKGAVISIALLGAFAAAIALSIDDPWIRVPVLGAGLAFAQVGTWRYLLDERDRGLITRLLRPSLG